MTRKKLSKLLRKEKEKDEKKKEGEAAELKKKKTVYDSFWKQFSSFLRVGCYDDDANRMKIAKLLMFRSSKSGEKHVSLTKYIQNMVEGQESIFYMSGLSPEVLLKSAHIQKLNKKNYEVLFLTDASDEPCLTRISEFEGKKLVSIQKEKIELGETAEDKKRHQRLKDFYKPLTKWWEERIRKETESGELKSVKISTRPR